MMERRRKGAGGLGKGRRGRRRREREFCGVSVRRGKRRARTTREGSVRKGGRWVLFFEAAIGRRSCKERRRQRVLGKARPRWTAQTGSEGRAEPRHAVQTGCAVLDLDVGGGFARRKGLMEARCSGAAGGLGRRSSEKLSGRVERGGSRTWIGGRAMSAWSTRRRRCGFCVAVAVPTTLEKLLLQRSTPLSCRVKGWTVHVACNLVLARTPLQALCFLTTGKLREGLDVLFRLVIDYMFPFTFAL
ncbi:proline-rich receptor-like protein kinase PERK9 [Iris pallida]|uniref:Proline-rich receptor-like protein kinase PERK9 n=1 Tax=Iris pallida TaxID=29817 RepID=A0AAX6HPJ8_IRIPA|nr:proline-rich receptor-like protein kinase PERK9 [Iris pallida]